MELNYKVKVSNGILEIPHRQKMSEEIRELCEDGEYELTIKKKKKVRSSPQNRYYWGVIVRDVKKGLF